MIARGAEESTRERFLTRLLQTLGDSRESELNRASAANAIFNLAPAMPPGRLDEVLDVLRPLAKGEYEISGVDQDSLNSNHPLSAFRINMTAPFEFQACALTAWARLVTVHDLDDDLEGLQEVASANLFAQHERLIRAGLEAYAQVDRMTPPLGWEQLFGHPADRVRLAALDAWRASATALTELSARHDLARDRFLPVKDFRWLSSPGTYRGTRTRSSCSPTTPMRTSAQSSLASRPEPTCGATERPSRAKREPARRPAISPSWCRLGSDEATGPRVRAAAHRPGSAG